MPESAQGAHTQKAFVVLVQYECVNNTKFSANIHLPAKIFLLAQYATVFERTTIMLPSSHFHIVTNRTTFLHVYRSSGDVVEQEND